MINWTVFTQITVLSVLPCPALAVPVASFLAVPVPPVLVLMAQPTGGDSGSGSGSGNVTTLACLPPVTATRAQAIVRLLAGRLQCTEFSVPAIPLGPSYEQWLQMVPPLVCWNEWHEPVTAGATRSAKKAKIAEKALPSMILAKTFLQPLTVEQQAAFKYHVAFPPAGPATTGKPHPPLPIPSDIGTLRSHNEALCCMLTDLANESSSLAAFLRDSVGSPVCYLVDK